MGGCAIFIINDPILNSSVTIGPNLIQYLNTSQMIAGREIKYLPAFFEYNHNMKEKIQQKIQSLSHEAETLVKERESLYQRDKEIEVRLHQLVGAIFELEGLLNQENQPSEELQAE